MMPYLPVFTSKVMLSLILSSTSLCIKVNRTRTLHSQYKVRNKIQQINEWLKDIKIGKENRKK